MKKFALIRKFTIKRGMLGLMLLCWFLPFLLIAGLTGSYMSGNHFENEVSKELESLSFHNQVCIERLNRAVELSKAITYNGVVNREYRRYQKKEITKKDILGRCSQELNQLYTREKSIQDAILWLGDDPENGKVSAYNESVGGIFRDTTVYQKEDHEAVSRLAQNLGTGICFYEQEGRVYLIRNLMDSSFEKIATLVLRLNAEYCLADLESRIDNTDVTIWIDDMVYTVTGDKLDRKNSPIEGKEKDRGYFWDGSSLILYGRQSGENYEFMAMRKIRDAMDMTPFYGYRILMAGMLALLIPMLILTMHILKREFSDPVELLLKGTDEIEKGNLGYQMEKAHGAQEFVYLTDAFNEMSKQLEYQFIHIYEEEIALRDARIMALQSHINPHFMNNTLEIINWEARMNGDEKVSEMIEALSVLMDATIDRKRQPEVRLSEEMQYVNAYLRILKARLGKRLQIINEFQESIMEYRVPRLILQPIIENAVEHGAVRNGTGTVMLKGHREGKYLYLDIFNDGGMTREEAEKVQRLLQPDYDTSKESSGNMGIANVNQRLKILYGEPCGLTLENLGENQVRSRLTILVQE